MQFTVAIDGPAAAGKGTIARLVAAKFGFAHLDTGLLYRAVGRKALAQGQGVIPPELAVKIAIELSEADINRDDLRTSRVAQAASKVAVLPEVRAALLKFQTDFARREGGAILDGRDIGSVICPNAEVKLFVTASDRVRAQRRFGELRVASPELTLESVERDIRQRDMRDASRDVAPMVPANDALMLDTTNMTIDAAVQEAVAAVNNKI